MEISVIIPVYNKKRYLPKLMSSLQAQTFQDYECLIVDDGSTDGSAELCDEMAHSDTRIRVFHIPNGGVSHARNYALDRAHGTYITFIDSDDGFREDYLENLYRCITTSGADLVIGSSLKVWEYSDRTEPITTEFCGVLDKQKIIEHFGRIQEETGIWGFCWNKIMKATLIDSIRFDEHIRLAEDLDFYLSLYPKVSTIYFDKTPCYFYMQDADNSSMQCRDDRIDYVTQLRINIKMRDFLKEENALSGKNQEFIFRKINNYLYFSLYHCPQKQLGERFAELYQICAENNVVPQGEHGMQKLCLDFLRKNQPAGVKAALGAYRSARVVRNSLRKK